MVVVVRVVAMMADAKQRPIVSMTVGGIVTALETWLILRGLDQLAVLCVNHQTLSHTTGD